MLTELGSQTARLLGTIAATVVVRGIEYYDALDDLPAAPGLILLAPSIAGIEGAGFDELTMQASRLGFAAVAVKCKEADSARLAGISSANQVPLIRVADHVSWRHFEALLARAIGDREHGEQVQAEPGSELLFTLTNQLASFFGGSVVIEDLERRVIAYSSVPGQLIDRLRTQGILARRVPDYPFNDDEYRMLLRSESALKFPRIGDEEPRVACAIRAGSLPLGSIWAIDASGESPITAEQDEQIRAGAAVAAAQMMDALRIHKSRQRPREDRLRTLLEGTEIDGAELAELGISEERGGALCAFQVGNNVEHSSTAQLRSVVQRQLALHRPEVVTAERSGRVYALVEHEATSPIADLLLPILPLADRLVGPGVRIAAPGLAHRSAEVAPLKELADRLFDAVTDSSEARFLTVEEFRPQLIFARTSEFFAGEPELRAPGVERLIQDEPRVAEAVSAWLSCFGNIARTARMLDVHENTVRYRIRRANEHFGLSFTDVDAMLALWLQIRSTRPPQNPPQE
ncbi:CdaR family transcriptional regulator [Leucobacter sp. 7(1)]|uniref:PucR family transcriptional regulator n=1 Tax=Leucobacter sp. 7(1) TaxID=1255613 RepID=UPI0020CC8E77|nr:PucR family transcriptional regulator [Leucobacter sp. 7(1)]